MIIHTLLAIADDTPITLTDLTVSGWGRALIFRGLAGERPFTLTFDDCREMRWRIYAHLDVSEPTPLVEFAPGRDQHRSPAQMLTGHFGLSVFYGALHAHWHAA